MSERENEQRRELADFLRAKRQRVLRADLGLNELGGRKPVGLRREEVSVLAGISVTWYTYLEQARKVNPSKQVLLALAHTLQLSAPERDYLLRLAGYLDGEFDDFPSQAPDHLVNLINGLSSQPAFVLGFNWDVIAWNDAYRMLYPPIESDQYQRPNLLRSVFCDPYIRSLLPDWELQARRFLAQFRAEVASDVAHPLVKTIVAEISAQSDFFAQWWQEHDIESFQSTRRYFDHPQAGTLVFDYHRLNPTDYPQLHVVIYSPVAVVAE